MGSICSKSDTLSGGHQVLGSASPAGASRSAPGGQRLGSEPASSSDPRTAAAEAAERRLKAAQERGTHASNPKRGQLAAKLEASKAAKAAPERQEERLVWD